MSSLTFFVIMVDGIHTYVLSTLFIPDRAFTTILATTTATPALRGAVKKAFS